MPDNAIINEDQNQITYNVVIDPGDIARQAEEIRNQLDLALGVGSNAGTQFASTTDFINPQFAPLPEPDFNTTAGQFSGAVDQTFWQKAQARMGEFSQDISAGYDRIRQDLSMVAERGGNIIQRFQPEPQSMNPYENLLPDTFGEYLMGSLGFGGDITGPIAPSEYKRYSNVRLGEELSDFGKENMGAIVGTAIGAFGGPAGAFTGWTIGSTVDEAVDLMTGTYQKREDLTKGLQEIARQQYGMISEDEARGVANQIVDYTFSTEGVGKGYDLEEISQNILQFANEGGFSNVKNTEQFKEKIQAITEDLRQFGRDMGVFQEEAISILAEMEQRGIAKVENMREISSNMKFYSGVTGMAPTELLQGAAQTAEQFRETLAPSAAMDMYIDAQVEATRMVRSTDPNTQSMVYRLGGQQGVTQALMGSYDNMFQGGMGQLQQMSMYYNQGTTGNPYDIVNTGATNFTGGSYYDFMGGGGREATKDMSLDQISLMWGERAMGFWNATVGPAEGPPTMQQLKGVMNSHPEVFGNLTPQEVDAIMGSLSQRLADDGTGNQFQKVMGAGKQLSDLQSAMQNNETTMWGDIKNLRFMPGGGSIADLERSWKGLGDVVGEVWDAGFGIYKNPIWDLGAEFGGWSVDYSTGEIDYGAFTSETTGGIFTPDMAPTDAGLRKQLMMGANSEYRQGQKKWMLERMKEELPTGQGPRIRDTSRDEAIVSAYFGDLSGILKDDTMYAYSMLRTGPDIKNKYEEKGYYLREVENLLEADPSILTNEDGSLKSAKEVSDLISSQVTDKFNMAPEMRERVIYDAMKKQENETMKKIVKTDGELKKDEEQLKKDFEFANQIGSQYNEAYVKDIDDQIANAEHRFKTNVTADLFSGKLPESLGKPAQLVQSFTKAMKSISDDPELSQKVDSDKWDVEVIDRYIKEIEKDLGRKVNAEERSDIEVMFTSDSKTGKSLIDFEGTKAKQEYAPLYKAVDAFADKQLGLIEGDTLDRYILKSAARMTMDRNVGSGQTFQIMDPDEKSLTEYGKVALQSFNALRETVTGEGANVQDFKNRLEDLRVNMNWSTEEAKTYAKETYNYDMDDNKDMGFNMRISKDELVRQSGYLYTIAKKFDSNVVAPNNKVKEQ